MKEVEPVEPMVGRTGFGLRRLVRRATTCTAAALALSGCGGKGGPSAASAPAEAPKASTSTTGSAAPTSTDAPVDPEGLAVRREVHWPAAGVADGPSVTVVGTVAPTELARVRDAAAVAWQRCAQVWPEPLPAGVILVPKRADEAQALATGAPPPSPSSSGPEPRGPDESASRNAATATTVVVGEPGEASARIHFAPGASERLGDEGLRVILTHECVHVGLSSRARPDAPRWLVEGAADVIAYGRSTFSLDVVTAPFRDSLTADARLPTRFPRPGEFETAGTSTERLRIVYGQAADAARTYADGHGESALVGLLIDEPPGGYRAVEQSLLPVWRERVASRQRP